MVHRAADFKLVLQVAKVLAAGEIVPVRTEFLFASGSIEYVAISPLFHEIEPSEPVPEYLLTITRGVDEELTVTAEEQHAS